MYELFAAAEMALILQYHSSESIGVVHEIN
jgi:hypothetical protein